MRLEDIGPGTIIAGRFEIKERIGAGGMGMVFRALDQELGNHVVAIKLLLPHLAADAQIFRRFLNEVLVARSLSHPNICRIHDIGKAEGGFHYISMEYVDGESLRERLLSGAPTSIDGTTVRVSPLSFEEAVSILFAVAGGVAYAHEKGVIHRDLKPANILMNKKGEVKLADFGTARIMGMDTSLTQTGQVIGTPDYMSPEQIRGENLDSACDIYALGIIGYELVTAQRPFVADSAVAVAFKHLSEPLPSLAPYSIPEWYQELVVKAAAKDKADRFRSGTDFCAEIQRNLPEIVKQTGYYPASSTMQNRTPSTPRNDPPTPPPGPLENPAPIVPPAAKQDSPTVHNVVESDSLRFELGNPSTLEGSEQWALSGSNSLSGRDSRNNAMLPLIIGFLTLALLGTLFILFRDTIFPVGEPDNRPPREVVVPSTQHVQEQLNQTPVPTSIPELKPTEIAVLVPTQTVLIPTAVPAVTIAVVGPTSAPTELATEVPTAVAPTPQPTLAPTVAPTLAPTVAPTVTTAPLPTISSVTGSFSLESHGTKVRDIEITQLADLTWSAVLKGAENTTGKVSLIVVSSRTKRTVGSTGPLEQSRQADGSIAVEGTLGGIVDRLEAGEYRVDLTYNGTVLVSKRLNVTETVMPQPTEAAIDDPGPQPTSNGGLGVPVGQTPIAEEQYGAAENYSGSIEWPDGSGSATRKALKLELQFGTTSVMGRAEIEGFGEFRVSGEVLPRGLSLTLRGPEFGIRLVSGKRSDMLRGTFMPPGEKTQRSFEAKKQ